MWLGHESSGVSVFTDGTWKHYPKIVGPLGERVYDIAVSPNAGEVCIATNLGISIYRPASDDWRHVGVGEGLPSHAIRSLAFTHQGDLIAGSDGKGIAISAAASEYARWTMMASQTNGLPSDGVKDILVTRDGYLVVGTDAGLARSGNGNAWSSLKTTHAGASISCLIEERPGVIWVGYWKQGFDRLDLSRNAILAHSQPSKPTTPRNPDFAAALLIHDNFGLCIGGYGTGLGQMPLVIGPRARVSAALTARRDTTDVPANHPAPWRPSTAQQDLILLKRPSNPSGKRSPVVALPDDWSTKGNWMGRYGRYWAMLGAMYAPQSHAWGPGQNGVVLEIDIGRVRKEYATDTLRLWIHDRFTGNPKALEMPPSFSEWFDKRGRLPAGTQHARRQSEWDDHGEEYPMEWEGPDVYANLRLPPGQQVVSLYFVNKDGHTAQNRWRDYTLSIREVPAKSPMHSTAGFDSWTELASGKVCDFWGGVYKRFLVQGPCTISIRVGRNHSFNTILSAIFVDPATDWVPDYERVAAGELQTLDLAAKAESTDLKSLLLLSQHIDPDDAIVAECASATALAAMRIADPPRWAACQWRMNAAMATRLSGNSSGLAMHLQQAAAMGFCDYPRWEIARAASGRTVGRAIERSLRFPGPAAEHPPLGREYLAAIRHRFANPGEPEIIIPQETTDP